MEPGGPHLDERRVRRLGGRQGPRTHARPALRHRRLRGHPRLRDRARHRRSSATATTSTGCYKSAELYYMPIPYELEELRAATHELIARNGLRVLLHPPDRLPRLRPDGPVPARRAGRRRDRGLAVGRLPRRGGQAPRRPRQGLVVAADLRRLADPARQGLGPVPQQRAGQDRDPEGRLRGGDPARRARPRLRGLGREHLRRPRRRHRHARPRRPRSSTASTASRSSRSPATSATRSSSATSPAPSSTSPTRSS